MRIPRGECSPFGCFSAIVGIGRWNFRGANSRDLRDIGMNTFLVPIGPKLFVRHLATDRQKRTCFPRGEKYDIFFGVHIFHICRIRHIIRYLTNRPCMDICTNRMRLNNKIASNTVTCLPPKIGSNYKSPSDAANIDVSDKQPSCTRCKCAFDIQLDLWSAPVTHKINLPSDRNGDFGFQDTNEKLSVRRI